MIICFVVNKFFSLCVCVQLSTQKTRFPVSERSLLGDVLEWPRAVWMHLKLLVRFTPDVVKRHLSPVLIPAIATKKLLQHWSQRPHRCCPPANKVETTDYGHVWACPGMSKVENIDQWHVWTCPRMSKVENTDHRHVWACPRMTHTRLMAFFWILLKQETVSGSGISWAICKSARCSRQITMPAPHYSVFYRPDALPAAQPTASKHWRQQGWVRLKILTMGKSGYAQIWPLKSTPSRGGDLGPTLVPHEFTSPMAKWWEGDETINYIFSCAQQ